MLTNLPILGKARKRSDTYYSVYLPLNYSITELNYGQYYPWNKASGIVYDENENGMKDETESGLQD